MSTIDHLIRRIMVRILPTRPHLWSAFYPLTDVRILHVAETAHR